MSEQLMQAIRVHQYGGPEQLKFERIPIPALPPDQVLIRVRAAGVLPIEWKIRQGLFRAFMPTAFPSIPGSSFSGIVEEVGSLVTGLQRGQAVFGRSSQGTYAEYTLASPETIALKPEPLSFDEAATISGGATTAWNALFKNGELQAGQRVLIHGAAGGVGSFAVQLAHWKGVHVIGTASTANLDFVRSLGAEHVIDYTAARFEQVAHDVDLMLDTIGGETLQRSVAVLKPGGTLVSLLEQPSQEQACERGIRLMKHTAEQPFPSTNLLQTIAQLIAEGEIKAVIASLLPLREASHAHELSQSGHGRGRIVLHMDERG
jgi:NADPH:quinone reductase-like Zn-dependent oxidoreductase